MENIRELDEYSEEIDEAFSSLNELNDAIESISEQNDEGDTKKFDSSPYPICETPCNDPNCSTQYDEKGDDYEPKGQSFDVSQFSICEIFDNAPNSSRRPKPYDYNRFSERDAADDEALYYDNEQFYANDEAGLFDVHRYSIGEILDGAPDSSKRSIADVRFRRMEEELSNLHRQCFEKDEYIRQLTRRLKDSGIKASVLRKNIHDSERRAEELEKNLQEANGKADRAQAECAEAKARVAEMKSKSRRKAEADLERQLKQVVSQHEKRRVELEGSVRSANEKLEDVRRELEDVKTENKLLSCQKGELFTVVTKQMKLVANLRRQILHIRAGVLKDFTEEEIRKAIESRVKT